MKNKSCILAYIYIYIYMESGKTVLVNPVENGLVDPAGEGEVRTK